MGLGKLLASSFLGQDEIPASRLLIKTLDSQCAFLRCLQRCLAILLPYQETLVVCLGLGDAEKRARLQLRRSRRNSNGRPQTETLVSPHSSKLRVSLLP